jgi:hypothetical protein
MVDVEALAHRARRVADRGRARMAIRVAWAIAPLASLSIASGAHAGGCLCIGVVLLAVASWLRWRGRAGIEAVTTGLVLGAMPFAAALLLRTCGIECGKLGSITPAELTCFAAGAVAGAGVSLRMARASHDRRGRWLATLFVASLTAAVGCVGLGAAGVLATLVAMLASATVVWIPIAARAT